MRGRKNKDLFANRKAQGWWSVRTRFQNVHRWVVEGKECSPDEIISISSEIPVDVRSKLCSELSQPTYELNGAGKIVVDKAPDGTRSPNLADALVIRYARVTYDVMVGPEALLRSRLPAAATVMLPVGPRAGSGLFVSPAVLARSRGA